MANDPSFTELMKRLRAGDKEAARLIFQRYADRLIGLARCQLDAFLRQKVDAEDVVQAVFKTFFQQHKSGRFDLCDWHNLWGLLVVSTLRKCVTMKRRFYGRRRDIRKEIPFALLPGEPGVSWEALAREPTPFEAVVLAETLEQLMRVLDERERKVLKLLLQGYNTLEIGKRIGRSPSTAERIFRKIREKARGVQAE